MIPWDALIALSWHLACEESRAWNNHWNQANLKAIYKATLQDYTGPPSEWAAEQFVHSILDDQEFLAIFLGQEPHVNQRLAKLSASASYLTDTCYWQIAHLWCAYHREAAETTSQRRAGVPVEFDCGPCPNQPPITVCCPIRQAAPLEQQRKFHGNPPVADV